jgi:hypothetical protein
MTGLHHSDNTWGTMFTTTVQCLISTKMDTNREQLNTSTIVIILEYHGYKKMAIKDNEMDNPNVFPLL